MRTPLQWLSCQLHANELSLCHLMKHFDGSTTEPQGFSGVIGSALSKCELLPLCNFNPICNQLPQLTVKAPSTDQRYLYKMCQSISNEFCSEKLARLNPGKLAHSRWLTAANKQNTSPLYIKWTSNVKHHQAAEMVHVTFSSPFICLVHCLKKLKLLLIR